MKNYFISISLILLICVACQPVEIPKDCTEEITDKWFAESSAIAELANTRREEDLHQSYVLMEKLTTPSCLQDLQGYASSYYFNYWKAKSAFNKGQFSSAEEYSAIGLKAIEKMRNELERLEKLYEWSYEYSD